MSVKMTDSQAEPSQSPLGAINQLFHQGYANKKQQFDNKIRNGSVLLMVRMDSRLISLCGDEINEYVINGDRYHKLKAVTHATLAVYYTLQYQPPAQAIPLVRKWLQTIENDKADSIFTQVAEVTRQFVTHVEQSGTIKHSDLSRYTEQLEPVYAQLLIKSADDEVQQLVKYLDRIRHHYKKAKSDTFLVIFGGHQSRYRELTKQVFTKWYNHTDESIIDADHHIKYSEKGETLDDAVDIVATAMTDRELAKTFLGNAQGLNQDVLGNVAKKAIERFWQHHPSGQVT